MNKESFTKAGQKTDMGVRFVLSGGKEKIRARFAGLTDVCSFEKDECGSIRLCWIGKNSLPKTIRYFSVTVYFLDERLSVPSEAYIKRETRVDSIAPQEEMVICSNVGCYPDACFAVIGEVDVKYIDGTACAFYLGQVAKMGSILSRWDGTAAEKTEY